MHDSPIADKSRPSWTSLYAVAEPQAGYFTTRQAAEAGYSSQLLLKHIKAGRMRRVMRRIYRLVHFPTSELEDLVEYWLWTDRIGVVSHETALFHHGLSDVRPTPVVLTVPVGWRTRRLRVPEGLTLRHGEIGDAERSLLGPVPTTSPARTIRDTIDARLEAPILERALAQAYQRGLITLDDAHALVGHIHRTLSR